MGFLDSIENMLFGAGKEPVTEGVLQGFDNRISYNKLPTETSWFFNPVFGQARNVNINQLRLFSSSVWIKMAIDTIIEEVNGIEWDIVPIDQDNFNPSHIEELRNFYAQPNRNNESLKTIHKKLLRDILEIDAGSLVKTYDKSGKLAEIWAKDGSTFVKLVDRFGVELGYYQYSLANPTNEPLFFSRREIAYLMQHPQTISPYGWSPIQSLLHVIETLNNTLKFNRSWFEKNAIPSGVLEVLTKNPNEFKRFRDHWISKIKGRDHAFPIVNHPTKFTPFIISNKEMQWLEGQQVYMKLCFAMYKITPAEAGFTDDVNKATAESQERISNKKAIKPLLKMLEDMHNNRVIKEEFEFQDVMFTFLEEDLVSEQRQRENDKVDLETGVLTINEVRGSRGLEPVEWGDEPFSPQQSSLPQSIDNPLLSFNVNSEQIKKKSNLIPEKQLEFVSEKYEDFIVELLDRTKRKVLTSLKREKVVEKTFAGFLSTLINITATATFAKLVEKFVKKEFSRGVESVESNLNIDIGLNDSSHSEIKTIAEQQLNGYQTSSGHVFPGIKGVNEELKNKILGEVQKGLSKDESIKQISKRIEETFETTKSRATKIARTESNRIINSGKLNAAKSTGIPLEKTWLAFHDNRSSPICLRLSAKYGKKGIPLNESFVDDETGQSFDNPPAHVHCRSTISIKPIIK